MPITYRKLFHLLLDREIKKGELQEMAGITASIMARLARNETVKTETIGKICEALNCQPGDIMEYTTPLTKKDENDMQFFEKYIVDEESGESIRLVENEYVLDFKDRKKVKEYKEGLEEFRKS